MIVLTIEIKEADENLEIVKKAQGDGSELERAVARIAISAIDDALESAEKQIQKSKRKAKQRDRNKTDSRENL